MKLLSITIVLFTAVTTAWADCAAEYERIEASALELSYEAFDQTQGQGFRVLAEQGCPGEAANLIEAWIEANGVENTSLVWHAAQTHATAGNYESALAYARASLKRPADVADQPLLWNDYVLATIGFLEGDRQKLSSHRERVAKGKDEYWGNELNLKLLDKLLVNFGQSYQDATRN